MYKLILLLFPIFLPLGANAQNFRDTAWLKSHPDTVAGRIIYRYLSEKPEAEYNVNAFLAKNLTVPHGDISEHASGKAFIQFVVSDQGEITDVKLVRSSGYTSFDKTAIRAVQDMPRWKPGKVNGIAVNTYFTIPISFEF